MVAAEQAGDKAQTRPEEVEMGTAGLKLGDHIPVNIPALEKGLLEEAPREERFLDFLKAQPSRDWLHKFGFSGRFAPFTFLRRNSSQREGPPRPDPLPVSSSWRRRFRVSFVRKFSWSSLVSSGKKWIKNPANMAFLVWLVAVAACLLVMLLVASGLLNGALPRSSQRKEWQEVNAQILNALFTILCLYQHPKLIHHLVLLLRWKSKDAAEVRLVYSKKGILRPHERAHMLFVVVLLHITCMAQYTLCALYWAFKTSDRPDMVENIAVGVGTIAPITAGVYTLYGPLGRKVNPHSDEESQNTDAAVVDDVQAQVLASNRRVVVTRPQWVGGLFDCWDDLTVAYLSFFCTFCVFGWNMERLGFGNMYVHIATFVLLVVAPFLVFNIAGLNIDDNGIREAVGIIGILLCFLGLLYGGFWRIQMRKKFKLPANGFCCGRPNVTDCMQWLFCWPCSLAQEVRTGNFYDIEEDSFYKRQPPSPPSSGKEGSSGPALQPLPREGGSWPVIKPGLESPVVVVVDPAISPNMAIAGQAGLSKEDPPAKNNVMTPPTPSLIQMEGRSHQTVES